MERGCEVLQRVRSGDRRQLRAPLSGIAVPTTMAAGLAGRPSGLTEKAMAEPVPITKSRETDPSDWWAVDREILHCLAGHEAMTPAEISRELGLSEAEAASLLAMLVREGKVRICQVMLAA
jgi:IclR helix-turn-helix domain